MRGDFIVQPFPDLPFGLLLIHRNVRIDKIIGSSEHDKGHGDVRALVLFNLQCVEGLQRAKLPERVVPE
jgi:hypothetical protein